MSMRYACMVVVLFFSCTRQSLQSADVERQDTMLTSTSADDNNDVSGDDSKIADPEDFLFRSIDGDTTAYVGFASSFRTTEPYIRLQRHHLGEFEITDWFDSTIEEEGNYRRVRLHLDSVARYFDLSKLDTLLLYDGVHDFQKVLKLRHTEWEEDLGLEQVVAVYNNHFESIDRPEYVLSPNIRHAIIEGFKSSVVKDKILDEKIINDLKLKRESTQVMLHVKLDHSGVVYSIVTVEDKSHIIETNAGHCEIILEQTDGSFFYYLLPVPILVKGKPLLLVTLGMPDTESHGLEYLIAYDGKVYEFLSQNRIPLSRLDK
jgi:hypothetical protein